MHFLEFRWSCNIYKCQSVTKEPNQKKILILLKAEIRKKSSCCATQEAWSPTKGFINFNSSTFTVYNSDFSNSERVHEVRKLLMQQRRKIQKNPSSKTNRSDYTGLSETVSIACKLSSVSFCPVLGQLQTKLGVGRREWQLAILLRLYLCKALFHMPTHLLLGSWQRSAAEGTYLPFVLLPPFHFSNPSCMEKPGKEKQTKNRKGRHVKFVVPLCYLLSSK